MALLADSIENVIGTIKPPTPVANLVGEQGLNLVLSNIIKIIMSVGAIVFVFMIVFSAFQWITSGGDKEAVQKARARLTYAIIGIVLLSLSFVIVNIVGKITGLKNLIQ